ncbi:MAG: type II toxin-antitoxin system Phd/YefM family antitoxin [Planctomycetes bacterium]|nr:type II toxin-antitoxin system Phd/YefM family antitoxin [Planctomycetota bacterium]
MTRMPNIIPITDLRQDATSIVNRVSAGEEPVVITQRGRAAAVMVSIQAYERSQRDLELLRLLARGEKEIEAGEGHDLDAVLAEADALLKGIRR